MPRIVLSDEAPADAKVFSLANDVIEVGASGFETDNREILANAQSHPWLDVEVDEADGEVVQPPSRQVRPEDDPLSAVGPGAGLAFDPEEIRKAEEAKAEVDRTPVAIEAGLDQDESQGKDVEVAETLADDPTHEAPKSSTRKSSRSSGADKE